MSYEQFVYDMILEDEKLQSSALNRYGKAAAVGAGIGSLAAVGRNPAAIYKIERKIGKLSRSAALKSAIKNTRKMGSDYLGNEAIVGGIKGAGAGLIGYGAYRAGKKLKKKIEDRRNTQ